VTRRAGATQPIGSPGGGFGVRPAGSLVAPMISIVGLLVVALVTAGLFTGQLPLLSSTRGGGTGNNQNQGGGGVGDPNQTAAPSNVVVVDPRTQVPGSIVFAKQGNIWIQSGDTATQVTNTGRDSQPSWSPDGKWIYFIESAVGEGLFPQNGAPRHYDLTYPILTRIHPDGTGRQKLTDGRYRTGPGNSYEWFYWLREPVLSPDGHTLALFSDGPDPTRSDVVLQFYDVNTKKMTRAPVVEDPPLGHQDAAWRPDGKQLLYVYNSRDGSRGAPSIWTYDPATKKSAALTGPGYTNPSWSPDGKWIAATRTTTFGTDIVILNAKNGNEVLRLTNDGRSWAPTWSPNGDAIAFLHINYQIVDLQLIPLTGRAPSWTPGAVLSLTQYSGLDGSSRPGWYIPPDQLTTPAPAATPGTSGTAGSTPSNGAAGAPGSAAPSSP